MKAGAVVVGIIFLVLGVGGFLYAMNTIAEYQTVLGQVGRAISEEHRNNYEMLQYMQIGGAMFGVFGLVLAVVGAAKN